MEAQRYVVMGAGEVGYHLARVLANEGNNVTVIERDPGRQLRVSEELDVLLVAGDGGHYSVLEEAGVGDCDLFIAVSSNDNANLVASLLAKQLGARRSVVRVSSAEGIFEQRHIYEEHFRADLVLSTQMLTTSRILNQIRGHNTMAVETYAGGRVQLRKLHLEAESLLTRRALKDVELPRHSLVVALFRGGDLIIPSGEDRPQPGDDALILGKAHVISQFEGMVSDRPEDLGKIVIAGGGQTGRTVARALEHLKAKVTMIERDRSRAEELAARFPRFEVLHGDATDLALLQAERVGDARTFVALLGNDEADVLACLLAQELGVGQVIAMVQRTETSALWRRLGLKSVFSPRSLANEWIHQYIKNGFSANIVSLSHGAAQVVERRLFAASPVAGATLAEISPPRGLIVGTVVRGTKVFVPSGGDRLEVGDLVILFVKEEEMPTVQLLFPDPSSS